MRPLTPLRLGVPRRCIPCPPTPPLCRPANVTLKDFAYFLAVPTLVYEPRYPRTRRVRWHYVARKLAEAAACALFQYAVMKQFMLPVLEQASRSSYRRRRPLPPTSSSVAA